MKLLVALLLPCAAALPAALDAYSTPGSSPEQASQPRQDSPPAQKPAPANQPPGQTPPAPPVPGSQPGSGPAPAGAGPVLDVDGDVATPGRFPKSTTPEALAAFQRILAAGIVPGTTRTPVSAFDLTVDLRYKASARETNDLPKARFRYLTPRYLRRDATPGREHLRGDKGDFVIETKAGEAPVATDVSIVRNGAEDRRQIDESIAVARNFVGLTDPASLRIVSLRALTAAPADLPPQLVERAAKLVWVEIESPDFFVPLQGAISRSARVAIGATRETGLPELALVDDARSPRRLNDSTLCIQMAKFEAANGFLVPRQVFVHRPEPSVTPPAYMREAAIDMIVLAINLRPALTPLDFLPP